MSFARIERRPRADWLADDPVVDENVICIESQLVGGRETDTGKIKYGNGRRQYSRLPYSPPDPSPPDAGVQATGTLTVDADVANNETIDVNGVTFTFKNLTLAGPITPSATQVAFSSGDSRESVAAALAQVLSDSADADVALATYEAVGNVIYVTYNDGGTAGNAFELANSSNDAVVASDATLTGGEDVRDAQPGFETLTDAATVAWAFDGAESRNAQVTLADNRTLDITGVESGATGTLKVVQSTGGNTLALPANSLVVNDGAGVISLSAGAGAVDVLSFVYDGTNFLWTYGLNFTGV